MLTLLMKYLGDIWTGPPQVRSVAVGAALVVFSAGAFTFATIEHYLPALNVLGLSDVGVAAVGGGVSLALSVLKAH